MDKSIRNKVTDVQRYQIIHDNFFNYLSKKGISSKKYASDNSIDPTLLSKWKKGDSKMTTDQIYVASQYFEITVNDLYYSPKEKKALMILADSTYDPILAKQTFNLVNYSMLFKDYYWVIVYLISSFILMGIVAYFLLPSSPYWIGIVVMGMVFGFSILKQEFIVEKTYIINYLDDIFYQREDTKNRHLVFQIVANLLILVGVIAVISLLQHIILFGSMQERGLAAMLSIVSFLYIVFKIITLFMISIRFEKIVYHTEFQRYKVKMFDFMFILMLITATWTSVIQNFQAYWIIFVIYFAVLILSIMDIILISKDYSNYKIYYEEYGKVPRELFPELDE